jgi:3-methyladenine DNA glycosylase Tag
MPPLQEPQKIKTKSLDDYLEVLSKTVFQTGISWKVVENKWPDIRAAFHEFDVTHVAGLTEEDIDALSADPPVIRNYRKLTAIVENARRMVALDADFGSFKKYLRSHGDYTATSKAVIKEFKFMRDTGTYFFCS